MVAISWIKLSYSKTPRFFIRYTKFLVSQVILLGYAIEAMEQHDFKNVNNCLNTNIYSFLEASAGQSSNLYLNVVHFFNTSANRHLWRLKTVLFLHWCLIWSILFVHVTLCSLLRSKIWFSACILFLNYHLWLPCTGTLYQGSLTEGKGSIQLTSFYQVRSAPFYIENIIYSLTKQVTKMRRSTVLSIPLQ